VWKRCQPKGKWFDFEDSRFSWLSLFIKSWANLKRNSLILSIVFQIIQIHIYNTVSKEHLFLSSSHQILQILFWQFKLRINTRFLCRLILNFLNLPIIWDIPPFSGYLFWISYYNSMIYLIFSSQLIEYLSQICLFSKFEPSAAKQIKGLLSASLRLNFLTSSTLKTVVQFVMSSIQYLISSKLEVLMSSYYLRIFS
jgi:hypothetical protein